MDKLLLLPLVFCFVGLEKRSGAPRGQNAGKPVEINPFSLLSLLHHSAIEAEKGIFRCG